VKNYGMRMHLVRPPGGTHGYIRLILYMSFCTTDCSESRAPEQNGVGLLFTS